jgi:hypothetical protein
MAVLGNGGLRFLLRRAELFGGPMIQLIERGGFPINAPDRFLRFAAECEAMATLGCNVSPR